MFCLSRLFSDKGVSPQQRSMVLEVIIKEAGNKKVAVVVTLLHPQL